MSYKKHLYIYCVFFLFAYCSEKEDSIENSLEEKEVIINNPINDSIIKQNFKYYQPHSSIVSSFFNSLLTHCVLVNSNFKIKSNELIIEMKIFCFCEIPEKMDKYQVELVVNDIPNPLIPEKYTFDGIDKKIKGFLLKDSVVVDVFDEKSKGYFEIVEIDFITNKIKGGYNIRSAKDNGFIGYFNNESISF